MASTSSRNQRRAVSSHPPSAPEPSSLPRSDNDSESIAPDDSVSQVPSSNVSRVSSRRRGKAPDKRQYDNNDLTDDELCDEENDLRRARRDYHAAFYSEFKKPVLERNKEGEIVFVKVKNSSGTPESVPNGVKLTWLIIVLHPRYKTFYFLTVGWEQTWIDEALRLLRLAWTSHYKPQPAWTNPTTLTVPDTSQTQTGSRRSKISFDIAIDYGQAAASAPDALEVWLTSPALPLENDPIGYHSRQREAAKTAQSFEAEAFAQMCLDYLSAPATSVDAERLFSFSGGTIMKLRNQLSEKSAHSAVMVGQWASDPDLIAVDEFESQLAESWTRKKKRRAPASAEAQGSSKFSQLHGVKLSETLHINLDEWLDPKSPQFNSTLASAIFHYSPRTTKEEHLEVYILMDEMKQAAWNICDSCLLLFIIMAINEDKKGVPLAFLLFSMPTGNQLFLSGYDTEILAKLLKLWRALLEKFRDGKSFYVLLAITDTDLKEHGALICVFPGVILIHGNWPWHIQDLADLTRAAV
ncbi:hypothetical protein MSAN_00162800 [Mycena sanguinolenta]|uniref:HAT C-terminal dimerisation domain-containing protein n=1 Tax=Mycena sanguinolenta TaxID=230812 RepID=A0A8H7DL30_9AGAR|nr:hypothetical protein MSAN_00162800 [Mycena sanguinolenta]